MWCDDIWIKALGCWWLCLLPQRNVGLISWQQHYPAAAPSGTGWRSEKSKGVRYVCVYCSFVWVNVVSELAELLTVPKSPPQNQPHTGNNVVSQRSHNRFSKTDNNIPFFFFLVHPSVFHTTAPCSKWERKKGILPLSSESKLSCFVLGNSIVLFFQILSIVSYDVLAPRKQ